MIAVLGRIDGAVGKEVHIVLVTVGDVVGIDIHILLVRDQGALIVIHHARIILLQSKNHIGDLGVDGLAGVTLVEPQRTAQINALNRLVDLKRNIVFGDLSEALIQCGIGIGKAICLDSLGINQNLFSGLD